MIHRYDDPQKTSATILGNTPRIVAAAASLAIVAGGHVATTQNRAESPMPALETRYDPDVNTIIRTGVHEYTALPARAIAAATPPMQSLVAESTAVSSLIAAYEPRIAERKIAEATANWTAAFKASDAGPEQQAMFFGDTTTMHAPAYRTAADKANRNNNIDAERRQGLSVTDIAALYNVSKSTVYRALNKSREAAHDEALRIDATYRAR